MSRGIVRFSVTYKRTRVEVVSGSLTAEPINVIVNASNENLRSGSGVNGHIHQVAGPRLLEEEEMMFTERGVVGHAYGPTHAWGIISARWIVHAIGPDYRIPAQQDPNLLRTAYQQSLDLAVTKYAPSIAFPAISTGIFAMPPLLAAATAMRAVKDWIDNHSVKFERIVFIFLREDQEGYYDYANIEQIFREVPASSSASPIVPPVSTAAPSSSAVTTTAPPQHIPQPQTIQPQTTKPQTTQPQTMQSQTTQPQTTQPQTTQPQTTQPHTQPKTTQQQTTQPQTTQPQSTQPQTTPPQSPLFTPPLSPPNPYNFGSTPFPSDSDSEPEAPLLEYYEPLSHQWMGASNYYAMLEAGLDPSTWVPGMEIPNPDDDSDVASLPADVIAEDDAAIAWRQARIQFLERRIETRNQEMNQRLEERRRNRPPVPTLEQLQAASAQKLRDAAEAFERSERRQCTWRDPTGGRRCRVVSNFDDWEDVDRCVSHQRRRRVSSLGFLDNLPKPGGGTGPVWSEYIKATTPAP